MIGIDIVKIERIKNLYNKFGEKALKKFLNDREIELSKNKMETIAGFYASKEAISKALGVGIGKCLSFSDIEIQKTKKNAPYFTLPKHIIDKFKIKKVSLSISHEKEYAIAVAEIRTYED